MVFALIFDSVGVGEWFVLLAVLLIVVGPKRLPETARKIGQYYAKFRRAAEGFKRQLMDMDYEIEREFRKAEEEVTVEGLGQGEGRGEGQGEGQGEGEGVGGGEGGDQPDQRS